MQDASAPKPPSLIKLGKLANAKKFDQLEEHWPEAVANPEYPIDDLMSLSGQVHRLGELQRADTFASALIEQVESRDGAEAALVAARIAVDQLPEDAPAVHTHLHRLFLVVNNEFEALPGLIKLLAGDANADQAVAAKKLDLYCALQPGRYFIDYNFIMPGVVETVNEDSGVIVARFEDRRSEYGPATVEKAYPKPQNYFPALVLYDPERLCAMAHDDPCAFVKLAIQADLDGMLTYKNLKKHVIKLLGDKGWTSWWKNAREVLRHDPILGMGAGSQPTFKILRQADRYEDRLRRRFDRNKDPLEKLKVVLGYLDETSRKGAKFEADNDLLVHYGNAVAKMAVAALKDDPALALACLSVHYRVAARGVDVAKPNPRAALAVLSKIRDKGSLVTDLPEVLLARVLDYLRESQPDHWAGVWCAAMRRAGRRQCDMISRGLVEGGKTDELRQTLVLAVERPTQSPDLIAWLWRSRHTTGPMARILQGFEELDTARCLEALLVMSNAVGHLHAVSGEERHLKVLETARADLTCNKADPLLEVIRESDRETLMKLRPLMVDNNGLNPALKSRLKLMLRAEHPEMFTEQLKPWQDPGIIYTTEAGLRLIQASLNHIVEEEIPAVAKQIGEAASHGDLSENSEWTAALEKRDQLASRATTMESELKQAKVIDLDMADSVTVNVGTRVTVREEGLDQDTVFTFLGPWDTDSERNILNYRAPLALAFMGAGVGETVEFGEDEDKRVWEVKNVEPGVE